MLMRYRERFTGELVLATRFKPITLTTHPPNENAPGHHDVYLLGNHWVVGEGDWIVIPEADIKSYCPVYVLGDKDFRHHYNGVIDDGTTASEEKGHPKA